MWQEYLFILRCPECKSSALQPEVKPKAGQEELSNEHLRCEACGTIYPIIDDIPILLVPSLQSSTLLQPQTRGQESISYIIRDREALTQKILQRDFHDSEEKEELFRPHGMGGELFEFIVLYGLRKGIDFVGADKLSKACILNVGCGSGMEAEILAQLGARILGVDLSVGILQRARKRAQQFGFHIDVLCGDAENLPIEDKTFDFSISHQMLHHLPDPAIGILELQRVSSQTLIINEPAKGWAREIAKRMGLAQEVEPSGNVVFEFSERYIRDLFEARGKEVEIHSQRFFMRAMQQPASWVSVLERIPLGKETTIALFELSNLVFGRWGNQITLSIEGGIPKSMKSGSLHV